jgi:acyl dehydratase
MPGAPQAGVVMGGTGVARVEVSKADGFAPGDLVVGPTGWQTLRSVQGLALRTVPAGADPALHLGRARHQRPHRVLRPARPGRPQPGQTVVVSAAAGSVGHLVGQIAKLQGCPWWASPVSDEKCVSWCDELGFDAAVNYRSRLPRRLQGRHPDRIDVYFDNTGGDILGSALFRMNAHGRIVCCGAVSQYDTAESGREPPRHPGSPGQQPRDMRGFLVFDYADRYDEAVDADDRVDRAPASSDRGSPSSRDSGPHRAPSWACSVATRSAPRSCASPDGAAPARPTAAGEALGNTASMATDDVLEVLRAHRFPGGTYRVAHWENFLLTDCSGRAPLVGDLVHPIVLFHAPILGAGTSIAELFAVGRVSGAGSVGLEGYDWRYHAPIREDVDYDVQGGVVSAERHVSSSGHVFDRVAFGIDLTTPQGEPVASVINTWRLRRDPQAAPPPSAAATPANAEPPPGSDTSLPTIPPWSIEVSAQRMKTMAAILRDPYPVHWDAAAVQAAGLGDKVINQGPLNLGYVANMLMDWAGDDAIRRLHVSFPGRVHDGDHVTARATVLRLDEVDGETRAVCAVELVTDIDGAEPEVTLRGQAEVAVSASLLAAAGATDVGDGR